MENTNADIRRNTTSTKNPKKRRSFLLKFFLFLLGLIFLVLIAGAGLFAYYAKDAPNLDETKLSDTLSSTIYDNNGNVILELGQEKREKIDAGDVPQTLKDAIVSIEDRRFYQHKGIDPVRIIGAALSNVKNKSGIQGGSTLTQQLIKLSYFSTSEKDQTLRRKSQEAWLAIQLERKKSKDQILTYYINKVFMANNLYGMETAAKTYFNQDLASLSLPQVALLAGIPQAPTEYDPYLHPEQAKGRRDLVLEAMLSNDKISQEEYENAINTPIDEGLVPLNESSDTWKLVDNYLKQVIEEAQEKTGKNVYTDGMDIYTNLDLEAQKYLYDLINNSETIAFPDDEMQVASTIIDVKTGQVKAQIGGRKIPENVRLGNNLAVTGARDVGSTIKPIADYAPAVEDLNYSSAKIISDSPYQYKGSSMPVKNYDNSYRGAITMREAVVDSRNIPAVKTLEEVGLDKSKEFLAKLGIDMKEMYYANAISGKISSLDLAGAYAAFANGGTHYTPYYVNRIAFSDGTEEKFDPDGKQAMKDSTAYIMTDILKNVISRGTGTAAAIPSLYQAGKTGTSNYSDKDLAKVKENTGGEPDITFVGYTTNYSISVWTGYNDYFHGIAAKDQTLAAQIYKEMMTYLSQGIDSPDWIQPDSVVRRGQEVYVKDHVNDQYTYDSGYNNYNNNQYSSSQAPAYSADSSSTLPSEASHSESPIQSSEAPVSSSPPEPPIIPSSSDEVVTPE